LLGTAASFAVARVFIGEIEALTPVLRTVEAASSVALKQKIVVGGVFAGLGAFLGQRAVSCGRSQLVTRAVAVAMLGSAVYVLLSQQGWCLDVVLFQAGLGYSVLNPHVWRHAGDVQRPHVAL